MTFINQSHLVRARQQAKKGNQIFLTFERSVFLAILTAIVLLRFGNLHYNSLFVDEAIYVTVGEEYRAGVNLQAATSWMFGSPLYPIAVSLANEAGGVTGMRILSALLNVAACLSVYLITKYTLGKFSALWAFFIFGLSPGSIFLGQYAAYDAPAVSFLAISLLCIVSARRHTKKLEYVFLFLAALSFVVSVLSKYIGAIYFPVIIYFGWVLFKRQEKNAFRSLFVCFVLPVGLILGLYAILFRYDLIDLVRYSGRYSTEIVDRSVIMNAIVEQIGLPILGACVGIYFLVRDSYRRYAANRMRFVIEGTVVIFLLVGALALPIYHIISSNTRGIDKHCVYALIFLAPMAGYGFVNLTWRLVMWAEFRPQHWRFRVAGMFVTVILAVLILNNALDRNWSMQHAWPNALPTLTYLQSKGINSQMKILASGSAIYEYYLDTGVYDRSLWQSTWYFYYEGGEGVDKMRKAIRDNNLDYVILDDYYTPWINEALDPVLQTSGYTLQFQYSQALGDGGIIRTRIFAPPST